MEDDDAFNEEGAAPITAGADDEAADEEGGIAVEPRRRGSGGSEDEVEGELSPFPP